LRFDIAGTELLGWQAPRNAATNTGQALANAAKFATNSRSQATNCDFDTIFAVVVFAIDCCRSACAKLDPAGQIVRSYVEFRRPRSMRGILSFEPKILPGH
jgi:hypothetical protein